MYDVPKRKTNKNCRVKVIIEKINRSNKCYRKLFSQRVFLNLKSIRKSVLSSKIELIVSTKTWFNPLDTSMTQTPIFANELTLKGCSRKSMAFLRIVFSRFFLRFLFFIILIILLSIDNYWPTPIHFLNSSYFEYHHLMIVSLHMFAIKWNFCFREKCLQQQQQLIPTKFIPLQWVGMP